MILLLSSLFGCIKKPAICSPNLYAPPETFQVAWISRLEKTAWPQETIEVVPMKDLRLWVHQNNADTKKVLEHLGMRGKNDRSIPNPIDYKITIFDVERTRICRPIDKETTSSLVSNVQICEEKENKAKSWTHRHGFTGCGYTINTATQKRSLDVYRVQWIDASALGFCVFPMARFLDGA